MAHVPVLVLAPIGERLRSRLSSTAFERAVLVLLVVVALTLAARAVS